MSLTYKPYPNSQYIILSDGTVARVLKQTKIHNQIYFNLILDKKMKRINKTELLKAFQDDGLHTKV